jgi:hypothetical protein
MQRVWGAEGHRSRNVVVAFPQGVPELVDALLEYPVDEGDLRHYAALGDSSNWAPPPSSR